MRFPVSTTLTKQIRDLFQLIKAIEVFSSNHNFIFTNVTFSSRGKRIV